MDEKDTLREPLNPKDESQPAPPLDKLQAFTEIGSRLASALFPPQANPDSKPTSAPAEKSQTLTQFGNRLSVFLSSTAIALVVIVVGVMILLEEPKCDTDLVLWVKAFLCVEAGFVLVQSVVLCTGKISCMSLCFMLPLILLGVVLLVLGNIPLYKSEDCDEGLWLYVFVLMILFYVIVGIVCCCCLLVCCVGYSVAGRIEDTVHDTKPKE